jgi:AcrR family transcriptional regulator
VAEITAAAGTSDPAFYRLFPSLRDAALFIMGEYYWRPLNQRIAHFREVTDDPGKLFEAVVTALIRSAEDDPTRPWLDESKVFRIVVSQSRNPFLLPDSLLDPDIATFLTALETILREGRDTGVFAFPVPPRVLARALVNTLHGLLVDAAVHVGETPPPETDIRAVACQLAGFARAHEPRAETGSGMPLGRV